MAILSVSVYERLLKKEKYLQKSVKIWNKDSITVLQGCFDCTIWEIFDTSDINEYVASVSVYINFCVDSVIPTKSFYVYPNEKPWVSLRNEKNSYRRKGHTETMMKQSEGTYRDKRHICWINMTIDKR